MAYQTFACDLSKLLRLTMLYVGAFFSLIVVSDQYTVIMFEVKHRQEIRRVQRWCPARRAIMVCPLIAY